MLAKSITAPAEPLQSPTAVLWLLWCR